MTPSLMPWLSKQARKVLKMEQRISMLFVISCKQLVPLQGLLCLCMHPTPKVLTHMIALVYTWLCNLSSFWVPFSWISLSNLERSKLIKGSKRSRIKILTKNKKMMKKPLSKEITMLYLLINLAPNGRF